ncbi:SDR family oxidoreductase [Propionibacterium australiense]|uniref:Short-chain dehydrogenase/reductase SDR n=1 Tax=Propionibacterium australiense TaxID=119981 RepID=A0A383S5V2_9ACTN|nr:SDR family oxidoreductase [Propionibacterium australiense]RLP12436.1 SDR family oxidoreductase [Propionibacterium australiense]SYZ32749.1 Short-chain dehydrogenase/reductase SDR [Propionibacterium australiense]VEH91420.1 Glucose 1-dehydrogenase 2 [Propionibacterium australiense]
MDLGLDNRVFIITAASSGLGLASARALAAEGARTVLVARRQEALDEAVAELGADAATSLAADLSLPGTAQQAVDLALATWGRLDGAMVSVGGPPKGTVTGTTDEQWLGAFDSVFLAAVRTARAVLGANQAARLGFVLSISAKMPLADMAPSNGLRPGLAMLVKQLGDEIARDGGRTFGLLPGNIATQRMVDLLGHEPTAEDARRAGIPMERLGTPEEFGAVAAFMLSDAASYLTGCLLPVDGGMLRGL